MNQGTDRGRLVFTVFLTFLALLIGYFTGVELSPPTRAQSISCGTAPTLLIQVNSSFSQAKQNVFYSQAMTVVPGSGTPCTGAVGSQYQWALVSGTLPAGVTGPVATTGYFSGTPTVAGNYPIQVVVSDCGLGTARQTQTISTSINVAMLKSVSGVTISPATLSLAPTATGQITCLANFTDNTSIACPDPVYTSTNPTVATVTPQGGLVTAVSPCTSGVFASYGGQNSNTTVVTVSGSCTAPLSIVTTQLPAAYLNVAYPTQTLAASGGTPGYVWAVASGGGAVPTGMNLTTGGVLSGTPITTSSFNQIQVTDSVPNSVTAPLTLTVNTLATPISLSTMASGPGATLQLAVGATSGQLYVTCTWSDGTSSGVPAIQNRLCPVAFAVSPLTGVAPTVSQTGFVTAGSGAGTANITVSLGGSTSNAIAVTVSSASTVVFTTTALPHGQQNFAYPEPGSTLPNQLACSGGTAPYTYSLISGSMPMGLNVLTTGQITGTANVAATTQTPTFGCQDSASHSATQAIQIVIATPSQTGTQTVCAPLTVPLGGNSNCTGTIGFNDGSTQPGVGGGGLGTPIMAGNVQGGVTAVTATFANPIPTGYNVYVGGKQGADTTHDLVITDSSGTQTYTQVGTKNILSGDLEEVWEFCASVPITSVTSTIATGGAASTMVVIVAAVPGGSPCPDLDNQVQGGSSTGALADTTAALTTTNPADILLDFVNMTNTQTSFTSQTSGFVIPGNAQQGRMAMMYQIVSKAQSGLQATMNYGPTSSGHGSIFAAFKAGSSANITWNPNNGTATANGVFTVTAGPTASINFTYGALTSNTVTITVTGTTDTALNLCAPSTSGCAFQGNVGSPLPPIIASGNNTGANLTGPPTLWGSSNSTLVSVSGGNAVCNAPTGSTPVTITATNGNLTGTATVSCVALGTQSLLPNCNFIGTGGCSLPAGWTLEIQQGFETSPQFSGGPIWPAPPSPNQAINAESSITCSFSHSGSCSEMDVISYDSAATQWYFGQGQLPGRTFYLSYWDYAHGALFNTEYLVGHTIKTGIGTQGCGGANNLVSCPGAGQEELGLNTLVGDECGIYNCASPPSVTGMQGNFISASNTQYNGAAATNYGGTGWNHWEVWLHANTPGLSDGFERVYLNGKLFNDYENASFFGNVDMTGMDVEAGGWYTKNVWTNNGQAPPAGTCTNPSIGKEILNQGGRSFAFYATQCPPLAPTFTRYIDDIIVLAQ